MKEEYLILKRTENAMLKENESFEAIIYINNISIASIRKKIKELERAGKVPKVAKIKTGIG